MPSKYQRGGNEFFSDLSPSDLATGEFVDSEFADAVSGGGKRKVRAIKRVPKTDKKPTKAAKGDKKKSAKGGALAEDIKSLAVPFAILLAKQGLDKMFSNKKTTAASKASPMMTATSSRRKSAATGGQKGGDCGACAKGTMAGGNCMKPSTAVGGSDKRSRYAMLAKEIDDFLAKY